MPRFLYPSDAPLDPALVLFAQFGFTDLKDLARPDSEFANLLCHHRRHVHHPIAFERVHNLFAIASFDAFSVVPAEGYFDWGVCIKSQNSIRHCCSPCSPCCSSSGGSNPSSGGSGKSSGGSSSSSCSSSSSLNPDWHSSMLACARSRTIAAHGVSSEAASGECTPSFCFSCSSSADLRSCHSSSVAGSGCDLWAVRLAGGEVAGTANVPSCCAPKVRSTARLMPARTAENGSDSSAARVFSALTSSQTSQMRGEPFFPSHLQLIQKGSPVRTAAAIFSATPRSRKHTRPSVKVNMARSP